MNVTHLARLVIHWIIVGLKKIFIKRAKKTYNNNNNNKTNKKTTWKVFGYNGSVLPYPFKLES